jgi:hypothetical protein
MKLLATGALFVLLHSGIAHAQTPTPDPKPAPEVKLVTGNDHKHDNDADARQCLELKTNKEIILCAEKYLPRGFRAKAKGPAPEKPQS